MDIRHGFWRIRISDIDLKPDPIWPPNVWISATFVLHYIFLSLSLPDLKVEKSSSTVGNSTACVKLQAVRTLLRKCNTLFPPSQVGNSVKAWPRRLILSTCLGGHRMKSAGFATNLRGYPPFLVDHWTLLALATLGLTRTCAERIS